VAFEMKGGTLLSKGYGLIHRFSDDVEIRIEPAARWGVMAGHSHDKPARSVAPETRSSWMRSAARLAASNMSRCGASACAPSDLETRT